MSKRCQEICCMIKWGRQKGVYMETENKFTKENTLAVKGIAIFFLLTYHCLSSSERLHGATVSFFPLSQDNAMLIARCMETCVGLFAFLSVYGMTLSVKKKYADFEFTAREATFFTAKRYLHLVFTFLLPYIFCVGVTVVLGSRGYGDGIFSDILDGVMDILCVSHLFGTTKLITTWWYLSLEVLLIVFLPLALKLHRKFNYLMIFVFLMVGSRFLPAHEYMTKYLLVIPLGICFADGQVFERLKSYRFIKNPVMNKLFKFVLFTVLTSALYYFFDSQWGREHFEFALNGVLPVLVICWVYEFFIELPVIRQVLQFIGKHSAVIFYIHTFVRSRWLPGRTYSFPYAWQILLFVLGVSLGLAICLDLVKRILHYDWLTGRVTDSVVGYLERVLG